MPDTTTRNEVRSQNGSVLYIDGYPLAECRVCREEHTDIRWTMGGAVVKPEPICIYCANDRKECYRPVSYLGIA